MSHSWAGKRKYPQIEAEGAVTVMLRSKPKDRQADSKAGECGLLGYSTSEPAALW